jgi:hypothetical protein
MTPFSNDNEQNKSSPGWTDVFPPTLWILKKALTKMIAISSVFEIFLWLLLHYKKAMLIHTAM